MLQALERTDQLPELFASLQIFERHIERGLRAAQSFCGKRDATAIQGWFQDFPACINRANHVVFTNRNVFQVKVRCAMRVDRVERLNSQAIRVTWDQK